MSIRVSLRGMLKLIRFDTLLRIHYVGFSHQTTEIAFNYHIPECSVCFVNRNTPLEPWQCYSVEKTL